MAFRIEWCSENRIATIWMEMNGGVNKINPDFGQGFAAAFAEVKRMTLLLALSSPVDTKTFASVQTLILCIRRVRNVTTLYEDLGQLHENLRTLETLGKPVVAALNGSVRRWLRTRARMSLPNRHRQTKCEIWSARSRIWSHSGWWRLPASTSPHRDPASPRGDRTGTNAQTIKSAQKRKLIDELAEDQNQLFEKSACLD